MTTTATATATTALDLLAISGGASIEVATGRLAPSYGYMVAAADSREVVLDEAEATAEAIADYCDSVEWSEGKYLGLWAEAGKVYLDVSVHVETRAQAVALAQAKGELAVFDLAAGDTLYV